MGKLLISALLLGVSAFAIEQNVPLANSGTQILVTKVSNRPPIPNILMPGPEQVGSLILISAPQGTKRVFISINGGRPEEAHRNQGNNFYYLIWVDPAEIKTVEPAPAIGFPVSQ